MSQLINLDRWHGSVGYPWWIVGYEWLQLNPGLVDWPMINQ